MKNIYIVMGGELVDLTPGAPMVFRYNEHLKHVGMFTSYKEALDAWRANAQQTVDTAHMRFIIHTLEDTFAS